jgi:hypothetical protein
MYQTFMRKVIEMLIPPSSSTNRAIAVKEEGGTRSSAIGRPLMPTKEA